MARTTKATETVAEPKVKSERLTPFESHGSRFYRITVPRDVAEELDAELRYEFQIDRAGVMTFTPIAKPAPARKARATKTVAKKTTAAKARARRAAVVAAT